MDIAARLRNEVCLTSKLDWQDHVALAREAADEINRLQYKRNLLLEHAVEMRELIEAHNAKVERLRDAATQAADLIDKHLYSQREKVKDAGAILRAALEG